MKFDANFFKNPLNAYMAIIIMIMAGGGYAFWEFMYKPLGVQKLEIEGSLTRASNELQKINDRVKEMAKIEAQLEEQQSELLVLRNMFPDEEVVTSRLRDLHRAFRSSGVEILKFEPIFRAVKKEPKKEDPKKGKKRGKKQEEEDNDPRQYYNENFYSIEVLGGYHMIGQMFAEIANFPYPTLISDLSAATNPNLNSEINLSETQGWTPYTISLKFTLTTFTSRK